MESNCELDSSLARGGERFLGYSLKAGSASILHPLKAPFGELINIVSFGNFTDRNRIKIWFIDNRMAETEIRLFLLCSAAPHSLARLLPSSRFLLACIRSCSEERNGRNTESALSSNSFGCGLVLLSVAALIPSLCTHNVCRFYGRAVRLPVRKENQTENERKRRKGKRANHELS